MPHRQAEFQELCRECNARTGARCECCATPMCGTHLAASGWCRGCEREIRRRVSAAATHPRMLAVIGPAVLAVSLAFIGLAAVADDDSSMMRLAMVAYFPVSVLGGMWLWRKALARERARFLRERSRLG